MSIPGLDYLEHRLETGMQAGSDVLEAGANLLDHGSPAPPVPWWLWAVAAYLLLKGRNRR